MGHKKNITEAVRAASRENGQSSRGPRTEHGKSTASRNSLRHGILSRKVVLDTHEERKQYRTIWKSWNEYYCPHGPLEEFLTEEITNISWKLGITEGLETQELLRRQDQPDGIDSVFHRQLELPVSARDLPLDRVWDCERIVVRAGAGDDNIKSTASRGPKVWQNKIVDAITCTEDHSHHNGGHLEVQAVLGSSLDTMTRYRSALKRDLYRAIETLRKVQAERREREGNGS